MDVMEKRQMLKDYETKDRCRIRYVNGQPHLSNEFTNLPHWVNWGGLESISFGGEEYFHNNDAEVVGVDKKGHGITQIIAYQIRRNAELGFDEAVRVRDQDLVRRLTEKYEREAAMY